MASVVPSITNEFLTLFDNWLRIEPLVVSADLELGIEVAIERPREVGADRLCNAVAAFQCVLSDAIVVDLGTATKVEAITAKGVYLGGAIAPGISVSLDTLVARAAQLYSVPIEFPNSAIGTNTVEAMQSGLVIGHLAMIEGLVQRFRDQIGAPAPVLLTGGYAQIFWQRSDVFDRHEPELTLRGLLHIWNLNQ
jgi:type III pantothenate kinase